MRKFRSFISTALFIVLLLSCNYVSAETIHVDQTLESKFLTLHLDADVENLEKGTPLTIYATDYPMLDTQNWAEMFDGDAARIKSDGTSFSLEQLDTYAKYWLKEARLGVRYSLTDHFIAWSDATKGKQATGLTTTPEEAQATAQAWIDQLITTLGWDGYVFSACYTMPADDEWDEYVGASKLQQNDSSTSSGCYVVEFVKVLGNYSVAYDQSPYLDIITSLNTKGDHIQIIVDDAGIGQIKGYCRSYEAREMAALQITLDEAIEILRENMDYAECYPEEMPCEITEISLCYRLVQTLPRSDEAAAVKMEARPVWRFASNINRWDQQIFFMFIDAITGEVLP